MLGIALGLGSSVAWGISDFLGGLQSRRISALTVLLVSQPVGLVLALVVARGCRRRPAERRAMRRSPSERAPPWCSPWAPSTGRWRSARSASWRRSARWACWCPSSAGLDPGGPPGRDPGRQALWSGIAGVVLVAREPDPEWRAAGRTSVGLAALAALGFGTFFLGLDAASGPEPAWTIVAARAGGVATLLIAAAFVRPSMRIERALLPGAAGDRLLRRPRQLAVRRRHQSRPAVAGRGRRLPVLGGHRPAGALRPRRAPGAAPARPAWSSALAGVAMIAAGA